MASLSYSARPCLNLNVRDQKAGKKYGDSKIMSRSSEITTLTVSKDLCSSSGVNRTSLSRPVLSDLKGLDINPLISWQTNNPIRNIGACSDFQKRPTDETSVSINVSVRINSEPVSEKKLFPAKYRYNVHPGLNKSRRIQNNNTMPTRGLSISKDVRAESAY